MASIHPRIRALAEQIVARGKNKRAVETLKALLDKGRVSTDEIQAMGYNHPPRAIADIRDLGVPIVTTMTTSRKTGKSMAVYTFGKPEDIQEGRIGGRSAFSKSFKKDLVERYSAVDHITRAPVDERVLQIDHRIPYRIAGEFRGTTPNVNDFMLLDGSSQRAKSWSCENCPNMKGPRTADTCRTCFWAFPENYTHIATKQYRRTDIVWRGKDVAIHDLLKEHADKRNIDVAELLRRIARHRARRS